LGFLGVIVLTCRQTPRLKGDASSTGALVLYFTGRRGLRTSWLIVGITSSFHCPDGLTRRAIRSGKIAKARDRLEPAFHAEGMSLTRC
jgi:hypothetical protein